MDHMYSTSVVYLIVCFLSPSLQICDFFVFLRLYLFKFRFRKVTIIYFKQRTTKLHLCRSELVFKRPLSFYRPQHSYGKVMFSQASVIRFSGEGVWQTHTPGQKPPWADPAAQCMLGYISLPSTCWDTCPPGGHCSGRYASYWKAFLF